MNTKLILAMLLSISPALYGAAEGEKKSAFSGVNTENLSLDAAAAATNVIASLHVAAAAARENAVATDFNALLLARGQEGTQEGEVVNGAAVSLGAQETAASEGEPQVALRGADTQLCAVL